MKHVLIVGSSVIDVFATVSSSHFSISNKKLELTLGDKVPTDIKTFAVGGNGANIAVGLTRLGIPSVFYTYLGKDILSRYIEENLTHEGVEVIAERNVSENTPLHIIFDFESDRIIFSHYPEADHGFDVGKIEQPDFLYINSLAEKWEGAYAKALAYGKEKNIPIAFSPGSRQLDNLGDIVYQVIQASEIFFANKEESIKILKGNPEMSIEEVLVGMKKLGPKVVSVTDGKNGAYAIDGENSMYKIISFDPESQGTEKTGAGDAYASGFFGAYLSDKDVPECMRWGSANSNGTMQEVGAQNGLLNAAQMDQLLAAKTEFRAEKL